MNLAVAAVSLALSAGLGVGGAAERGPPPRRIVSLDQCADQYVLALADRDRIAGLSRRADDPDSALRARARGLKQLRVTQESILAAEPDLVVRYWGGDERLQARLAARSVPVVRIHDASDFMAVRANILRVGGAVQAPVRAERLISAMELKLSQAADAGHGRRAFYLTPAGFTAGSGTLVDAILSAAGLRNATRSKGYQPASPERLLAAPPDLFVLGFYRDAGASAWGGGRQPALLKLAQARTLASLPGAALACPSWAAADAALTIARAARRKGF